MKKYFLAAIIFMAIGVSTVSAQRPQRQGGQGTEQRGERMDPAERDAKQLKIMVDSLGLNADQTTKIKAIQKKYQEKFAALRTKMASEATRDAARTEMREIMQAQNTEVKAVLDAKQKVKYDAMIEKMRQRMGNRPEGSNRSEGDKKEGERRPRGGNN